MQLADYLAKQNLTAAEFARAQGMSKSFLCRLLKGKRKPSPDMARRLEEATGGRVAKHELRPDLWDAPKRRAA